MNESKYAFSDGKDSIDRVMKGGEVIPDSFPNSLSLDKQAQQTIPEDSPNSRFVNMILCNPLKQGP